MCSKRRCTICCPLQEVLGRDCAGRTAGAAPGLLPWAASLISLGRPLVLFRAPVPCYERGVTRRVWCRQNQRGCAAAVALAPGGQPGQLRAAVQAVLRRGVRGRALHLRPRRRCARSNVALQVVRSPAALQFQEVCCFPRLRSCVLECSAGGKMRRLRFKSVLPWRPIRPSSAGVFWRTCGSFFC